ncbi:MAG: hypothetical protein HYX53_16825 [Chloroflexi bacterium]|nr:hypothetical protein [Chloroflexota bacterium]
MHPHVPAAVVRWGIAGSMAFALIAAYVTAPFSGFTNAGYPPQPVAAQTPLPPNATPVAIGVTAPPAPLAPQPQQCAARPHSYPQPAGTPSNDSC